MSDEMVTDGVDGIRTTRMLERAVRQRWPIPEEYKAARWIGTILTST